MSWPNPSPQSEIFLIAMPIVFLIGSIETAILIFRKGFENEATFLFHRNLWFVIVLLFAGLNVSDTDTFYTEPLRSFLWISILLITTVFPATYQYRKKHKQNLEVFPSFCLIAILAISLYFKQAAHIWLHQDEITMLEAEHQKQRALDKKAQRELNAEVGRDLTQMNGMPPPYKNH